MRPIRLVCLSILLVCHLPHPHAAAAEAKLAPNDEQLLKSVGVPATGDGILEFFRRRLQAKPEGGRLAALARQLADKDAAARDRASAELVGVGSASVPLLRQAANELDEGPAAERASACLQLIEGAALPLAAARGLALFKPAGAAEVLLGYLPLAEDDRALEELTSHLVTVSTRDGKRDGALLAALDDPLPVRRAVAAEVLGQVGSATERLALRKLLRDPKLDVRRRVALVLAGHQDPEAVPALIGLLAELPTAQTQAIEEYLSSLAGEWAVKAPTGGDAIANRLRRDLWAAWWSATEGPALLEEFRRRTPPDEERLRIQALVGRLGDAQIAVRDKAMADVLALGPATAPYLRQASATRDNKTAEGARKCLTVVEANAMAPLPSAAIRLLALRNPPGAAEVLMAYLPSAEDDSLADEVRGALGAVSARDGKADPAIVRALTDASPIRRAAAAEALVSLTDQRDAIRRLLADPEPTVRQRASLVLGANREKDAVPVLIALLTELPAFGAGQVEDTLRSLADESAPDISLGESDASRKKCRAVWEDWWRKNADKADLGRLNPRNLLLGYTLVVEQYSTNGNTGRVLELDRQGKIRWQIEGLRMPSDAQMLPGDRVLICEQGMNRVSERDLKGKTLWEKPFNQPMAAQRLSNGNTLVVGRQQIVEFDRTGREVFNHSRPSADINCGKKLRNGHVVFITYQGLVVRLDATGKEVRTTRIPAIQYYGGYVDLLPNNHIVAPQYNGNKVYEYDAAGKVVWEATVSQPLSARRLPGGTTLVTSSNPFRVLELDRSGKVIWESKDFVQATRADRR